MAVAPVTPDARIGANTATYGMPVFDSGLTFHEVGQTGLRQYSGWVREEFLQALMGRQGARVYREMQDNNATIGAMLFAIVQTMRKIAWRVKPANESPEALAEAQFADSLRYDLSHTWEDFIAEALSMLPYGYCLPPEQLVMRENGTMAQASTVVVGDRLMTKEGRGRPVTHIFRRRHTGDMMSLRVRGYPHPIRMTPEHRLPTLRGWMSAGEVSVGDFLLRPRPKLTPGGDYLSGWFVGLYLAEGSREPLRNRVTFSLHDAEVDNVAANLREWIASRGLKSHHHRSTCEPSVTRALSGNLNSGRVAFSHPEFRALIDEWVLGDDSWTKALVHLPTEELFAKGVVEGWLYGDGCKWKNTGWDTSGEQGFTVSADLAHQMQAMAGALGLPSPLFYRIGGAKGGIGGNVAPSAYVLSAVPQRQMRWKRTEAAEEEVLLLRAGGMPMQAIAAQVGLSYTTVFKWLHSTEPRAQGLQCKVFQQAIAHEVVSVEREAYDGEVLDFEIEEDHTFCAGPLIVSNSVHEIVYKRRLGPQPEDGLPSSRYDDGRIGVRKLPIRGQDTIIKWFFGPNGEIEGLTQQPYTGTLVSIPIRKLLLFRPSAHKNNPEGRSILRNSYRSWFFLKRFEEEEAIFYERMSGVPCMFVPAELLDAAAAGDPNAVAQVNAYKRIVTNTKIGEQMGLLLPSNTYPNSSGAQGITRMYEFQLVTPQGRSAAVDSDKVITRHRLDMLMTVLADFVALGHGGHGTQSLAENKVDMFFQAIEGWVNSIAAVVNRHLLPRVWELNAIDPDLMPEFVPDIAQRVDIAGLADFVLKLAQSGMQMFPDVELENYLRDSAGMPAIDDTAYAEAPEDPQTQLLTPGDLAPSVAQRTATPGNVTQPSVEAEATGAVAPRTAATLKALYEAADRRARSAR